jgi:hypothetical protein
MPTARERVAVTPERRTVLLTAGTAATASSGGCLVGYRGTDRVDGPAAALLPTADDL